MTYTERLYFTDSGLFDFSAKVIETGEADGVYRVVLDRTAFYPTGGGQPNDTGKLGEADVTDVFEDESGKVFHVVSGPVANPGQEVRGLIDRRRRLDHLQQHSGQHILSQAFIQACQAETRSFHLGSATSTVDIELGSPADEHMRAAEDIANQIVFENRAMRVHLVDEAEAHNLPLRKESAVKGRIRVIEVEDFDWSPCGGTHAARTGQVGLIAIKSFERARKLTRVEFVCGYRALADYRLAHRTATAVARMFSADRDSGAELVTRALAENKSLKRRVRELMEVAAGVEAAELLAGAEQADSFKLVCRKFEDRDADQLRMIASRIVQSEPSVVLLGANDGGTARVVFARSETVPHNMGQLLAEACTMLGGRGGGKPELAQGGGPDVARLAVALEHAASKIRNA